MSFGVDIAARIRENAAEAVAAYNRRPETKTAFEEPLIAYTPAANPIFEGLRQDGLCDHPKNIFLPARTIIVYFIPYGKAVEDAQAAAGRPSAAWITAHREAGLLTALINGAIRRSLDSIGRITSGTNIPSDWQQDVFRPEWDHRVAAWLAGLGEIGPNGSFRTERGSAGKLGSCLCDGDLDVEMAAAPQDYQAFLEYFRKANETPLPGTDCPAGAVDENGFDHAKCQEYCRTIYDYAPSPELCGKCYR
ncbi:MAG: hypothetical protein ACOX41_09710 [Anaerovoracaceae bacterium]|jgi:epoxyqueuosine reductase QueG